MLSRGLLGVDCIVTTQAEAVSAHSKPIQTVAQRDCRLRLKVQESVLIISFLHRDFIVTKCQVLASLCRSKEIHSPRAQFSPMSKTWKKPNQEQLNIPRSDSEPNNYILYIVLEDVRFIFYWSRGGRYVFRSNSFMIILFTGNSSSIVITILTVYCRVKNVSFRHKKNILLYLQKVWFAFIMRLSNLIFWSHQGFQTLIELLLSSFSWPAGWWFVEVADSENCIWYLMNSAGFTKAEPKAIEYQK